jgi:hypothetical protein
MMSMDRILAYRGLVPFRYSPIGFLLVGATKLDVSMRVAPPSKLNSVARDGIADAERGQGYEV